MAVLAMVGTATQTESAVVVVNNKCLTCPEHLYADMCCTYDCDADIGHGDDNLQVDPMKILMMLVVIIGYKP